MWLYRGIQSAVFYYVTCTPCAEARDRNKRRKEAFAARRKKEKEARELVTEQPVFHQPTPFSTNPYWNEEITVGPSGPKRKKNFNKTHNSRFEGKTEVEDEESIPLDTDGTKRELGVGEELKDKLDRLGERWNWKRYQREEEVLWGHEPEVQGSSIGFSGRGRANTHDSSRYYIPRNPEVNELHPPVVSSVPSRKAETRWMLQPPPPAKIMEGKVRARQCPDDDDSLLQTASLHLVNTHSNDFLSIPRTPSGASRTRQSVDSGNPSNLPSASGSRGTSPAPTSRKANRPPPIKITNESRPRLATIHSSTNTNPEMADMTSNFDIIVSKRSGRQRASTMARVQSPSLPHWYKSQRIPSSDLPQWFKQWPDGEPPQTPKPNRSITVPTSKSDPAHSLVDENDRDEDEDEYEHDHDHEYDDHTTITTATTPETPPALNLDKFIVATGTKEPVDLDWIEETGWAPGHRRGSWRWSIV